MNAPAKAIEFKGTSLSVVSVVLSTLDMAALEAAVAAMPGGKRRFFDGDAAVLDLGAAGEGEADWPALLDLLRDYGLEPVGQIGGGVALAEAARRAGLVTIAASELARPARKAAAEPAPAPAPAVPKSATLIVDKPLRSGQRVYARGGDLILTAMVSAGAEVIADGSIHVYAPLRGRALAGAVGDESARVFATCFEAELVSIAGVYRTFEQGLPAKLARQPVQTWLEKAASSPLSLRMEPLALS
ncbi:MAG: septum site-determining protein MinC [Rhodocyclaceae bacterium]|nr:MAG: septum site-determining protein MinC [Rhodocyclaceae bacterium]